MNRTKPIQAIALGVLFTSGCQATVPLHAMRQPVFAMGQHGAPAEVAIATRPAQVAGGLTVSFKGELAQWTRRVLATVADVETVVVTVKPTGAAEVSQTVLKAAIANGQTSVTFQGLPPGAAVVTITAFDASGANIGSTTKSATVAAGQVATVDVALQLAPTLVTGTGGGSMATGGLTTNVSILDGPVIHQAQPGQLAGEFALDFHARDLALDAQGNAWVCGGDQPIGATTSTGVLMKLAPDGTVLKRITLGVSLDNVEMGAQGHLWVNEGATLYELDSEGAVLNETEVPGFGLHIEKLTVDSLGQVWGTTYFGVSYRLIPGAASTMMDFAIDITAGAQQTLWLTNLTDETGNAIHDDQVVRYTTNGARLSAHSVGAAYRSAYGAVDSQGNMWVSARSRDSSVTPNSRVVKFAPDGQTLGTYDISGGFSASAIAVNADTVWVFNGTMTDGPRIVRLSPTGAVRGVTELGALGMGLSTWCLEAGSSGAWFLGQRKVYRLAP